MLTRADADGMTNVGEAGVVFLLDIDNTLLDNDRFSADLDERLQQDFRAAALAPLRTFGKTVVLSDGDAVFQPRKVQRSGIWDAVDGRVLIYLHKQRMLDAVQRRFPAAHYVMVDDKPRLLAEMKSVLGDRLTTVFVRQGHYAREAVGQSIVPPPDLTIERISELAGFELQRFGLQRFGQP